MRAPANVGTGTAHAALTFEAWKAGKVIASRETIRVAAPKTALNLEAVSSRLKRELRHPSRDSSVFRIDFSPDGKEVLGADSRSGIVQIWNADSGSQLRSIETGNGNCYVSPDWQKLYACYEDYKTEWLEDKEGKRRRRWSYSGGVRVWDVATGTMLRCYQCQPPHGVRSIAFLPDGNSFLSVDELPGITEIYTKYGATLWDSKTGSYRILAENTTDFGALSLDGRSWLATRNVDHYTRAVRLIDVATGSEKWSHGLAEKDSLLMDLAFSPDGQLAIVGIAVDEQPGQRAWKGRLEFWDAATGKPICSIMPQAKKGVYSRCTFSPDGRTLAVLLDADEEQTLCLIDVADKRQRQAIALGKKDHFANLMKPTYSRDGRWLALMVRSTPRELRGQNMSPLDLPQPRIHLIDVKAGAIRETLVSPQAISIAAAFSPDGKTLATGGHGKVLLWDVADPPIGVK